MTSPCEHGAEEALPLQQKVKGAGGEGGRRKGDGVQSPLQGHTPTDPDLLLVLR